MPFRQSLSTLILIAAVHGAHADLTAPDCSTIAAWAADFQSETTYQVAPAIALPTSVGDEHIVPLFGKSIVNWSSDDFRTFNQQMSACQRTLFKTNREAANQMNEARKQVRDMARSIRDLRTSAQQVGEVVEYLLSLPASQQTRQILAVAQSALGGADIHTQIRTLPSDALRPLSQLERAQVNLATVEAQAQARRLSERSREIQASLEAQAAAEAAAREQERERIAAERAEAQARAAAELQAARGELASLPVSPDSLAALDRLDALAALDNVPPAEAARFREDIATKRQAIDVIVQREHTEQMALELSERLEQLQGFKVSKLADLGVLWQMVVEFRNLANDPRNADALKAIGFDKNDLSTFSEQFAHAAEAMLPSFKEQLRAIPETQAGLQQVRTAVADATGVRSRSAALQPYYAAAQQRAQVINAALRHAAEWLPVEPRLQAMLQGDRVDDATIRGLRPGMDHSEAVAFVKRQWGFEEIPNLGLKAAYGLGRAARQQLKEERRDGGELTLEAMEEALGQITFVEHYKAKLELDVMRKWLVQRFGEPDTEQPSEYGTTLTWRDDPQRLQVRAINQVDVIMHGAGYRSQLGLALWNDDYEDYLDEANERCNRIRKLPRNEMSIEQSLFFAKNCPMGTDYRIKSGL